MRPNSAVFMTLGGLLLASMVLSPATSLCGGTETASIPVPLRRRSHCARPWIECVWRQTEAAATPHMDRIGREGWRNHCCLVTNSICGPSGYYSHRQVFAYERLLQQHQQPVRQQPADVSKAVARRVTRRRSSVNGTSSVIRRASITGTSCRDKAWTHNPPMIRNGEQVKHTGYTTDIITHLSIEWLKNRDKSKPFLLMSQHKAPHREWSPPLRLLGWDNDRKYPEPETLFDDYAGRAARRSAITIWVRPHLHRSR